MASLKGWLVEHEVVNFMSKLICRCGHLILDKESPLDYKKYMLRDNLTDDFFSEIGDKVDDLIKAIKNNKKEEWIKTNFKVPPYPLDLSNSEMVYDLISKEFFKNTQVVYRCENCNRIAIQKQNSEQFKFFLPED